MRTRSIFTTALTLGLVASVGSASSVWAAEAGTLTAADLAALGGTDFDGGPGDYFLRNDEIEATILGITATPDFDIPIVAEALPGRGVIVDLGTRGDKNDQLTEIDHVVNIAANVIFYGGPAEGFPAPIFVSGGPTASITVFGVVLLDPISSPSNPTLVAQTTYSVTALSGASGADTVITLPAGLVLDLELDPDGNTIAGPFPLPFNAPTGTYTLAATGSDNCFNFTATVAFNLTVTELDGGPTFIPANFACQPVEQIGINLTNIDCTSDADCAAFGTTCNVPQESCLAIVAPQADAGQVCFTSL